jgi:hypothetical protein
MPYFTHVRMRATRDAGTDGVLVSDTSGLDEFRLITARIEKMARASRAI